MGIFYSENEQRGSMSMKGYDRWDANAGWVTHTWNREVLKWMSAAERDARKKADCEREILIAVAKIQWWERHPNFERAAAERLFKSTVGASLDQLKAQ